MILLFNVLHKQFNVFHIYNSFHSSRGIIRVFICSFASYYSVCKLSFSYIPKVIICFDNLQVFRGTEGVLEMFEKKIR